MASLSEKIESLPRSTVETSMNEFFPADLARLAQARLNAAGDRHAHSWQSSHAQSASERLSNSQMRDLVRFHLSLPVHPSGSVCTRCAQPMDAFGFHTSYCHAPFSREDQSSWPELPTTHRRHNRIQHLLCEMARGTNSYSAVELEPTGLFAAPHANHRPDIYLYDARDGPTALDVVVTAPLQVALVDAYASGRHDVAAARGEDAKVSKYTRLARSLRNPCRIIPVGLSAFGALGPRANAFVKDLARRLCADRGIERQLSHKLHRIRTKLCCIAQSHLADLIAVQNLRLLLPDGHIPTLEEVLNADVAI